MSDVKDLACVEFYDGRPMLPILHYETTNDGNVIRFCTPFDWYVGVCRITDISSGQFKRRDFTFYREELVIEPGEANIRLLEEPNIKNVVFIR